MKRYLFYRRFWNNFRDCWLHLSLLWGHNQRFRQYFWFDLQSLFRSDRKNLFYLLFRGLFVLRFSTLLLSCSYMRDWKGFSLYRLLRVFGFRLITLGCRLFALKSFSNHILNEFVLISWLFLYQSWFRLYFWNYRLWLNFSYFRLNSRHFFLNRDYYRFKSLLWLSLFCG